MKVELVERLIDAINGVQANKENPPADTVQKPRRSRRPSKLKKNGVADSDEENLDPSTINFVSSTNAAPVKTYGRRVKKTVSNVDEEPHIKTEDEAPSEPEKEKKKEEKPRRSEARKRKAEEPAEQYLAKEQLSVDVSLIEEPVPKPKNKSNGSERRETRVRVPVSSLIVSSIYFLFSRIFESL